jgi:type III secretion protein J
VKANALHAAAPRWRVAASLLSLTLLLAACGRDELYTQLDQQQANEMLALLVTNGIDAGKSRADNGWTLQTARSDLPRAMDLLKANGYPREKFQSLGEVFTKEGFVSSPLEERARLLYGLSQELSRTLSSIDGVVVARVHLALPERHALSDKRGPASAAVFIKHRPDSVVTSQVADIKALVVNSVEGLPYDNVTVTLSPAAPEPAAAVTCSPLTGLGDGKPAP